MHRSSVRNIQDLLAQDYMLLTIQSKLSHKMSAAILFPVEFGAFCNSVQGLSLSLGANVLSVHL